MKKLILLFVVILNLSCSKDKVSSGDSLPYFQFLTQDADKIINSTEVGKILIYKNQNNDELKFEVVKNKTEKKLESKGNWVYSSYSEKFFYYDEQKIEMQSTLFTTDPPFYISLKRWPIKFNNGGNGYPIILSQDSHFIANIGLNPFQNGTSSGFIDYTEPIQSLTINGITYNKVRKIEIAPITNLNPNWQLPSLHYIYFDQNRGVIGFDDIQNNEWRLQN